MLVSVHLPKTAGTSFEQLLKQAYGPALVSDYGDKPLHQSVPLRKLHAWRGMTGKLAPSSPSEVKCIHGHFLPYKYRSLLNQDAQFVTWLRNPVDRLQSHFRFWQHDYNPATAGRVHRRMISEGWDFERFALGPELRNIYSLFLWRFPLERFSFVGLFENLEQDMAKFCVEFLGAEREMPRERISSASTEQLSGTLRSKIESWHDRDMALYQSVETRAH